MTNESNPFLSHTSNPSQDDSENPSQSSITVGPEGGETSSSHSSLIPGMNLSHSRYVLKERLGRGGMGEVWRAYDRLERKDYALKFVLRRGNDESVYRQALAIAKRAYQKIAELSYPSICIPKHSEEDPEGGYFFVMPLLCGESLKQYRDRIREEGKKLTPSQVVSILIPIAKGLDYVHRQGLVHLDIKPQNIMLTQNKKGKMESKLIDFGLVTTLHHERLFVGREVVFGGTVAYMSPEQQEWHLGNPLPNHLSDQFSLALVVYQLLSGSLPKMKCAPDRIEGVSERLNGVLRKALSYQPKHRFSSCLEFLDNLKTESQNPPGMLKTLEVHGVPYRFHWSPPGSFMMGSPENEKGRFQDEHLHKATLTQGFWILETPVTQEMWQSVMGTGMIEQKNKAEDANGKPRGTYCLAGEGASFPMYDVSWKECQIFCQKLSVLTGQKITLPTEAQWEYACRAGTIGAYAGSGTLEEMGWYDGNSGKKTHEVGRKFANAWGLYDMHGNVWEWCQDRYGSYLSEPMTDPMGAVKGSTRVCRGGSWSFGARSCRSASRNGHHSEYRSLNLGFRLVLHFQE